MAVYKAKNPDDTKRIARQLLPAIKKARVVFLTGELGSGKTFFVKQLAKVLGIRGVIASPTFQLIKEYSIPKKSLRLIHVDLYRVDDLPELSDYLSDPRNLILIEWGEKLKKSIQPGLELKFNYQGDQWKIGK